MNSKGRILVIDDDRDFLEFIRIILESNAYEVFVAESTEDGLNLLGHVKPHVVLVDVMISYVLDGLNFIQKMRSDPQFSRIPIIVISAIVNASDLGAAKGSGLLSPGQQPDYDAFMTKPIEPKALLGQIEQLVARCQSC